MEKTEIESRQLTKDEIRSGKSLGDVILKGFL
jgi:hypothetical protein